MRSGHYSSKHWRQGSPPAFKRIPSFLRAYSSTLSWYSNSIEILPYLSVVNNTTQTRIQFAQIHIHTDQLQLYYHPLFPTSTFPPALLKPSSFSQTLRTFLSHRLPLAWTIPSYQNARPSIAQRACCMYINHYLSSILTVI